VGHNKVAEQPAAAIDSTTRFSLERKVPVGFALAALALLVVGIRTYISVLRFRADAGLVDRTHQVLNALSELVSGVTGAESGQRSYVITGKEEYLPPYQASVQAVDRQIQPQKTPRCSSRHLPRAQGARQIPVRLTRDRLPPVVP
jgi:hypothetical protein